MRAKHQDCFCENCGCGFTVEYYGSALPQGMLLKIWAAHHRCNAACHQQMLDGKKPDLIRIINKAHPTKPSIENLRADWLERQGVYGP